MMTPLKWLKKRPKNLRRKFLVSTLALIGGLTTVYYLLPYAYPIPDAIASGPGSSVVLLDRQGDVLDHWVRLDYYRHRTTKLELIPKDLIDATLAAEDKRFYSHGGVDFRATARAVRDSWDQQRFVSGASTITQQTVKITSKKSSRTIPTKIRECLTARHLEMTHSKDDILTAYFNHLDYGNRSQGPLQAARHYFGKPLSQLSLSECALLAGLPQAPSRLNPRRNPQAAVKRRNWILGRMQIVHGIDPVRISRAQSEPLKLHQRSRVKNAPHLVALMRKTDWQKDIQTSISGPLQRDITQIVREKIQQLEAKHIQNAAVIVIKNQTGEVLAHVGSADFNHPMAGQIDAAQTARSPGSALKPFTYLLSFQQAGMTPATIVADVPTRYSDDLGIKTFVNYDRQHRGPVTVHHALANSLNIPAVRTLNRLGGPKPLLQMLQTYGISTLEEKPNHYGLSLTLGSGEVTLTELTNAYACLARMGTFLPPLYLSQNRNKAKKQQVRITPEGWMLANTMSDNGARSSAFGAHSQLRLPFPCAVKTGTSSDFKDNWCLGFTADFTVGVWAGNLDNTPMRGVSGVTGAAPIFQQTMLRLHRDQPPRWFPRPQELTECYIHPKTGRRLTRQRPEGLTLHLPNNILPLFEPSQTMATDLATAHATQDKIPLPQKYKEWLETEGDKGRFFIAKMKNQSPDQHLRILSPFQDATYLIDPDLPAQGRRLNLRTDYLGEVTWSSPTLTISKQNQSYTAEMKAGKHTITLTSTAGHSTSHVIYVEEL